MTGFTLPLAALFIVEERKSKKMRRLVKLAAVPAAASASIALTIPVVKAEAVPNPESIRRKTVLPKDLPIYDDPNGAEYQLVPGDTSGYLYQAVSVVRKNVWKFSDSIQGAVDKTKRAYRFAERTEKEIVDYIKTEEGFYPRATAIVLAGLTGVVLARKGGVARKTLYSSALMGATASLCYPYQAVKITKAEYEALRAFWKDTAGSGVIDRVSERMGQGTKRVQQSNKPTEPTTSDVNSDLTTETAPSSAESQETQPPADHGMSNPKDKDMYSTRT